MARPRKTISQRLHDKFKMTDGCWEWLASRNPWGYGRVQHDGKEVIAHRAVYEWLVGPIPAGMQLDHLCFNRGCVNPAHMEPVTLRDNVLRSRNAAAVNARKTHCIRGHPLSEPNLVRCALPTRRCKTCAAVAQRQWNAAHPKVGQANEGA